MTLPAAYATISMGDINVELGRARTSYISLNTAENGGYATINTNSSSRPSSSDPAKISEWYSYNHGAAPASYSFPFSSNGTNNTVVACGSSFGLSLYSSSSYLYTGLTLYSNAALTTVFNGGNLYRKGEGFNLYRISTSGVITVIYPC